ncbi:MAG: flagellar assembly protein FliW [Pseudomonadaceae bacterium]|nr:flagellar assembly protein FliW [Pseudomonadaceae bacterium]
MNNPQVMTSDAGEELTFQTRFGEVSLRKDRLIDFPQGLFGFRECTQFGLTRLPNVDESPILLMQCVNAPEVAFLVADPNILGLKIAEADSSEAMIETNFPKDDTQLLSILTLYDNGDSYYLTANLKAPILIDSSKRTGVQYILSNKDYTTQHKI